MFLFSPGISVGRWRRFISIFFPLGALLLILSSCGDRSGTLILSHGQTTLSPTQHLSLPLIGTTDVTTIDPAADLDQGSRLLASMLYSGLVRRDNAYHILPDQATSWQQSTDGKTYTFTLKSGITFADGSPVTAQTYVDSWTRALRAAGSSASTLSTPADVDSLSLPYTLALPIVGAQDVYSGKSSTLAGVKAINATTLQVTLQQPTPTFLQSLTQSFFYPVNLHLLADPLQQDWPVTLAKQGIGTGPFIVREWDRNIRLILVPNPAYSGRKLTLTQVTLYFMNDNRVAFTANQSGRYDLTYDMDMQDQVSASRLRNYYSSTQLQTVSLFFDTSKPPFNSLKLRQAFAAALDKQKFAQMTLSDTVTPAETLYPSTMTGYQARSDSFDADQAAKLFNDATGAANGQEPPIITFTYPMSALSSDTVKALQTQWLQSLNIHVVVLPLQDDAYLHALSTHSIQFGIYSWSSRLNDPSDFASRLLSNSSENVGKWQNSDYDRLVTQAQQATGSTRLQLYHQAETIALSDAAIVPLYHETGATLVGPWVQGISYDASGLYAGDWSGVKILNHKA